jgi:signal peptidase I
MVRRELICRAGLLALGMALAGCGGSGAGSQIEHHPQTTYRVPSGSMLPTLKLGQLVTADNAAMRAHPPLLGDIVAVHPPSGADRIPPACGASNEGAGHRRPCGVPTAQPSAELFIKRVIGLPGDRIAIRSGHVVRNGILQSESFITPCTSDPSCNFPKAVVVPPGDYYVLGDNRGASDDSRFWGPVRRPWIVGLVSH